MNEPKWFYLYDHLRGQFVEVRSGAVCGREGDIRFDDDLVSRQHFRVTIAEEEVFIEDLNSTNPPHVNSAPMSVRQKRRVWVGDLIQIGSQRLTLTDQNNAPPSYSRPTEKTRRLYKLVKMEDDFLADRLVYKTLDRLGAILGIQALRVSRSRRAHDPKRLVTVVVLLAFFAGIGVWSYKNFHAMPKLSVYFEQFDCQKNPTLPYCGTAEPDRATSSTPSKKPKKK